jgi:hypothetical protein
MRWRLGQSPPGHPDQFFLRNTSQTWIRVSKRVPGFNPQLLLRQLNRVKFPIAYVEGLERIHLTGLGPNTRGLYLDNEVWVDVKRHSKDMLATFVHEVAHHLDDLAEISPGLAEERRRRYRHLDDHNARRKSEYLAIGFERFYSGYPEDRRVMRRRNPKLYRTIMKLHRNFS